MAPKVAAAKTRPTTTSVAAFLQAIADPAQRADCRALAELMTETTGETPRLWGTSIVGFGEVDQTVLRRLLAASVRNSMRMFSSTPPA